MLPTTTFTRGIDRALHAQRLGGPYQRRLDRHALGPPVHGQHGRREPRVEAVGAVQQERAAAAPEHARRRNVSRKISCEPMRQGDQMYIMMEWISAADPALRVVALPEEYYCPSMRLSGANPQSLHAEWANSYSQRLKDVSKKYHCRAVHGRFLLSEPDRRAGGMPHLKPPGA